MNERNARPQASEPIVRSKQYDIRILPQQPLVEECNMPLEKVGLMNALQCAGAYKPIHLNSAGFLPDNRKDMFQFTKGFSMPFPVCVYYHHMGTKPTEWFIWKVNAYDDKASDTHSEQIVTDLLSQMPQFHNRTDKRLFMQAAEKLTKTSRMDTSKKTCNQMFKLVNGTEAQKHQFNENS